MFISRNQNSGEKGNMQISNNSFESVEQFKYLAITLTYQNSIYEEIMSILKSGNACNY